jgi:PhzF family phenazine biosynthesis protein
MAIYQVDAFTENPYYGNPTAVVLDAAKYSPELKQQMAREFNLPITVFVSPSNKADYKMEFFTPRKEVEISGHGTIATFWLLAVLGKIEPEGDKTKITQETKQGIISVEIKWNKDRLDKVIMIQQKPTFKEVNLDKKKLADILGIRSDKIENNEKLPMVVASTGSPKLMILISSKEMTDALVPNFDEVVRLCRKLKVTGIHLYTFDTYHEGTTCYTRQFQPVVGVPETPISGLANGALGALLVKYGFAQP